MAKQPQELKSSVGAHGRPTETVERAITTNGKVHNERITHFGAKIEAQGKSGKEHMDT